MSEKTTVYLNPTAYADLKRLAKARGVTTASLVREAVSEYAARNAPPVRVSSLGLGRSGAGDLSERAEELLRGMGGTPRRGRKRKR